MIFCLGYWCLLVFIMAAFRYLIKIPSSLQQRPKTHPATESLFKIVQMFFEHIYKEHPLDECLRRMYITNLHRLANNALVVMFLVVKTVAISKQTQTDLLEPRRRYFNQKIQTTTKSPYIMERTKLLISECSYAF